MFFMVFHNYFVIECPENSFQRFFAKNDAKRNQVAGFLEHESEHRPPPAPKTHESMIQADENLVNAINHTGKKTYWNNFQG